MRIRQSDRGIAIGDAPGPARRGRHLGVTVVLCAALWGTYALAHAASEMELGNQAFHEGNYREALRHYTLARDETDAPPALLQFNVGVAHARLGELEAAEAALIAASAEPSIAPRAYYSLGTIFHARNEPDEARVWFRQALTHREASPRLRELSRNALVETRATAVRRLSSQRSSLSRAEERLENPFHLVLDTQLAFDSNVYRAPSSPYVDLAQPGQPLVTPEAQSGWFAPVHLATGVRWGLRDDSEFALNYQLNGRLYVDSDYSNANIVAQRLALSATLDKRPDPKVKRGTFVTSALVVQRQNAQAYDRIDGDDQFLNGEDVSDRLTYTRYGPEFVAHRDFGSLRAGLTGAAFLAHYDDAPVSELDYSHEQYDLGTFLLYRPWRRSQIELSFDASQRNYDQWPARDLNGDRFSNAPTEEYFYREAALILRQRLNGNLWCSIGYAYTDREDQYLGYDDYRRHAARVSVYLDGERLSARAGFSYRDYTFPNAFAFDVPQGGEKTLTKTVATLYAEYRLSFDLTLNGTLTYDVSDSTDPRAEYTRNQASLGVRWEW